MKALAHITLLALISTALAQSPKASTPVASFVDVTANSGVTFTGVASHTSHKYLIETMGSGVATFDYDNDGLLDIFFVNGAALADPTPKGTIPQKSGPQDWNRLYHQKRDGTFEDVTERLASKASATAWGSLSATMTTTASKTSTSRRPLRHGIRWQPSLPQQRQWHLHRCSRGLRHRRAHCPGSVLVHLSRIA